MSNKLIVAAAGSGKTTYLVEQALGIKDLKVLITTYTEANQTEIRNKIIEENKFLPSNVTVQTWFSFLLQHGVRPYQGYFFDHDIKGMNLVNGQSARGIKESDTMKYYFDKQCRIYSDKISKFLIKCNEASNGKVIDRLSSIYPHIFIDEVQDLAGYDLDFLKLLFNSPINMLLVGDPRQGTYSTSNVTKNKKFAKSKILHFFEDDKIGIDDTLLTTNYRSIAAICDLSNKLFPEHSATQSGNIRHTDHDGIFLVRPRDVDFYLTSYKPM
ncbi:MAG: ATP-dependent helicase [Proteobacteria bacterium]|nr:ATP-dependent helicase [Pseudomonadota bacterium]